VRIRLDGELKYEDEQTHHVCCLALGILLMEGRGCCQFRVQSCTSSIILERHLVALPLNAYGRQIKNDAILSLMVFETYVPYVP